MSTTYTYAVRDRTGKLIKGSLEADSPSLVATKLKSMGFAPISVEAANTGMKTEIKIPGFGTKVKLKDLAVMSRQFATMINSGLSLLKALNILGGSDVEPGIGPGSRAGRHRHRIRILPLGVDGEAFAQRLSAAHGQHGEGR